MFGTNPYPGYRSFRSDERQKFFGREAETEALITRLGEVRLLAVVGPPEVGKSSLVAAGALAALGDGWSWALCRPAESPAASLAAALAQPEALGGEVVESPEELLATGARAVTSRARKPLVIVVDQFDEMFRYRSCRRSSGAVRHDRAFLKLLVDLAASRESDIRVVLTMRSEFVEFARALPHLGAAIEDWHEVGPLGRDGLRRAIEQPVEGRVSAELVSHLLERYEPTRFPGHLPIYQHGLMRSWERAHAAGEEALDLRHWRAIGRGPRDPQTPEAELWLATDPGKALRSHGEEIHDACSRSEQRFVARMFRTVTAMTEGGPARRPATVARLAELWQADVGLVTGVVEKFQASGDHLLMPPADTLGPDTVVDPSYDSLVWTLGAVWHHRETPLLSFVDRGGSAVGQNLGRLAKLAAAALVTLALAGVLTDRATELPVTEADCCPDVAGSEVHLTAEHIQAMADEEFGDVHLTEGDVQRIERSLDIHLTDTHVREISSGSGQPTETLLEDRGDLHLTERDFERIREIVAGLIVRSDEHMTSTHLAGSGDELRAEFGDDVGDVHLTRGDIELIRRAIGDRLIRVEPPPAAPRPSGPSVQFSDLGDVRAGFLYEVGDDGALDLPALGLRASIEPCPGDAGSGRIAIRVAARSTGRQLYPGSESSETACVSVSSRARNAFWSEADTENSARFRGASGFHYAIVVRRDAAGSRYAIVRRCAEECRTPPRGATP